MVENGDKKNSFSYTELLISWWKINFVSYKKLRTLINKGTTNEINCNSGSDDEAWYAKDSEKVLVCVF